MSQAWILKRSRRAWLPLSVFVFVWTLHYVWLGMFPEQEAAQSQWVSLDGLVKVSWWTRYVESQSYYLGFSYALALAFAVVALRRYQEERFCRARQVAIGGVTLSGFLAVAGCFLIGCCGSPMLAVYVSLFGTAFLPFAKPFVAALTIVSITAAGWWMRRARPAPAPSVIPSSCSPPCDGE